MAQRSNGETAGENGETAGEKAREKASDLGSAVSGRLAGDLQKLASAATTWAVSSVSKKLENVTGRLTDYADGGNAGGLVSAIAGGEGTTGVVKGVVKNAAGSQLSKLNPFKKSDGDDVGEGGNGGGGDKGNPKVTNIIETIDVGVPLSVAYNQWTVFTEFPTFAKKVEKVEQKSDEKLLWRAKVFFSSREWESTITEQVPDKRIVWRSKGNQGYVDGAVTFHEIAPDLTRIVLVLEYYPQGFVEKTANLWRAQGRRARLELKHFRRHVMTRTILHPEEASGWHGEIHEGEVTSTGEEGAEEEPPEDVEKEPPEDVEEEPEDVAEEPEDAEEEPPEDAEAEDTAEAEETGSAEAEETGSPEEDQDEAGDGRAARSQRRRASGRTRNRDDEEGGTPRPRRPARSSTRRAGGARTGSRTATDRD